MNAGRYRRHQIAVHGGIAALVLTALPGWAAADVLTTYNATKCWGDSKGTDPGLQRIAGTPNRIRNNSAVPMFVHCPIVKTTSAPGITNDAFNYADVPLQVPSGNVECRINVWDSKIDHSTYANIFWARDQSGGTGTMRIEPFGQTPTGYWDKSGAGAGEPPSWLYLDLICKLPPGASLSDYQVSESGTNQTGYRIYSSLSCAPDASNTLDWRNVPGIDTDIENISHGGYSQGQATPGGTKYAMKCPLPPNTIVRFTVGPAGVNLLGCNLNNTNLSSPTWTASTIGNSFPTEGLRQYPQPVMVAPVAGASVDNMICGVQGPQGDGKVVSYRTRPQPVRTAWVTSALVGANTANAKDNNGTTRWTTGVNGAAGQWFKVDFGSARGFGQVTMDSGTSTNDFARNFDVQVSNNNVNWTTVATATGTNRFISVTFGEQSARYFRIRLNSSFNAWWSIHELNVYSAFQVD